MIMQLDKKWLVEYIRLLFGGQENAVETANAFKNKFLPKYLYIYTHINPYDKTGKVYALENIYSKTVHLASPKSFNDPFDTFAHTKITISMDKLIRSLPINENERFNTYGLREMSDAACPDWHQRLHDYELARRESIKIRCFSGSEDELPINMPMWNHYADKHRGICIKYDTSKLSEDVKAHIYPVIYDDNPVDFSELKDYIANSGINWSLIRFAMRKHPDWSNEKEWRLIRDSGIDDLQNDFLFDAISAIYMGNKISESNQDMVYKVSLRTGVPSYKMNVNCHDIDD